MSFSYEAYPTQVKAFENRDVRVALAKAVDWTEINDKLYYDTRTVATSFAPPTVAGGGTDVCGDDCTFDPAAAKAMLEKAGGIPGNKVEIARPGQQRERGGQGRVQHDPEEPGCEVRRSRSSSRSASMLDAFNKLGADDEGFILGLGWGADNPTLANMIAPLFGTGSGSNYIGYSNPEFDKLIAEGNQAADEATAVSKWQEAEKVVYKDFAGHAHPVAQQRRRLLDQRVQREDQPGWLHQHRRDHGELGRLIARQNGRLTAYAVSQPRGDVPHGASPRRFSGRIPARGDGVHMGRYVIRRLLQMIPVFFGVTFIMYFLMFALGDPIKNLGAGKQKNPAYEAFLTEQFNLDDPFIVQYLKYLRGIFTGDFGSTFAGKPVSRDLRRAVAGHPHARA